MTSIKQAVIMAAGLGTRMRPLTLTTPKPMLPIAGRPLLEWSIDRLPKEIDEVILVVGYLQEQIRSHFGGEWRGRRIRYAEQKELKGTGHAVHACRDLLDERFVVLNGDDLYAAADIAEAMRHELAVVVMEAENAGRFGGMKISPDGRLLAIEENAVSSGPALVNTGCYVLNRKFLDYPLVPIKNGAEFGLPQTLVTMAHDHPVATVKATFWMCVGTPEDLAKADEMLKKRGNWEAEKLRS